MADKDGDTKGTDSDDEKPRTIQGVGRDVSEQLLNAVDSLHERVRDIEDDLQERVEKVEREIDQLEQHGGQPSDAAADSDDGAALHYVATVEKVTSDGPIIELHPDRRQLADTEAVDVEPGETIALDDSLNIVGEVEEQAAPEVQQMEIIDSPGVTFQDIGGIEPPIRQLKETVELPLSDPEAIERIGVSPPQGVLLHGPPGTGKTMLAKAVASEQASRHQLDGSTSLLPSPNRQVDDAVPASPRPNHPQHGRHSIDPVDIR